MQLASNLLIFRSVQVLRTEQLMMRWWWKPLQPVDRVAIAMALFPYFFVMMNAFKDLSILAWNVRGFANKKSKNHMHDLARRYQPDMIILFETHTMFASAENFWAKENYVKIDVQEVHGHSGGIWAM
ncbi:hypothetical protein TSUD_367300 [Trifolium subterraneum]|uniref:Endonuclease/exonuclease/phosphatase domain-containing protein n=1 Tax=Trifolium subterraneum TaxID=3900 RepID=A0A2Z6PEZ6_TRISU|nr:hypothetical protein TSUD_367300 [Trifolium subterraneum]